MGFYGGWQELRPLLQRLLLRKQESKDSTPPAIHRNRVPKSSKVIHHFFGNWVQHGQYRFDKGAVYRVYLIKAKLSLLIKVMAFIKKPIKNVSSYQDDYQIRHLRYLFTDSLQFHWYPYVSLVQGCNLLPGDRWGWVLQVLHFGAG